MTHVYNAAEHDSTMFRHFFLMFGRHLCLAIDVFLGIPQDSETIRSQKDYVNRIKQRFDAAYCIASEEPSKNVSSQNEYCDAKVRHSNLEVGDRSGEERTKGEH